MPTNTTRFKQDKLDFDDLQLKVRDLLQQESIREQLAKRYPYIMVDEYQDTEPNYNMRFSICSPLSMRKLLSSGLQILNWTICSLSVIRNRASMGSAGRMCRVFDRTRQEITDYQSALVTDFTWTEQKLEASDSEKRGELHLPENFRLLRNLVGFVNLVFEPLMSGRNEFEVKYEPLIQGRATDQPGDIRSAHRFKGKTGGRFTPSC